MTGDELPEQLLGARVRFWVCPAHPRGRVDWRGDVAYCMEQRCGRSNAAELHGPARRKERELSRAREHAERAVKLDQMTGPLTVATLLDALGEQERELAQLRESRAGREVEQQMLRNAVTKLARLEAMEARALDMARWPDQPEFRGPYASAAKRILTGENP